MTNLNSLNPLVCAILLSFTVASCSTGSAPTPPPDPRTLPVAMALSAEREAEGAKDLFDRQLRIARTTFNRMIFLVDKVHATGQSSLASRDVVDIREAVDIKGGSVGMEAEVLDDLLDVAIESVKEQLEVANMQLEREQNTENKTRIQTSINDIQEYLDELNGLKDSTELNRIKTILEAVAGEPESYSIATANAMHALLLNEGDHLAANLNDEVVDDAMFSTEESREDDPSTTDVDESNVKGELVDNGTKGLDRALGESNLERPELRVFNTGDSLNNTMKTFKSTFNGADSRFKNQAVVWVNLNGVKNDGDGPNAGDEAIPNNLSQIQTARVDGLPYTYKGIEGVAYCADGGSVYNSCSVEEEKLVGQWYFIPWRDHTDPKSNLSMAYFYKSSENSDAYKQAQFAQYGMWLEKSGDDFVLQRRVGMGIGSADSGAVKLSSDPSLGNEATYEGEAKGLFSRSTQENESERRSSGHFTADVEMNATFGDEPKLSGTINNFRGGAISDWTIDLTEENLTAETISGEIMDGHDDNTEANSGWTATAYGEDNMRPTGFYGGFNAHFEDGRAAGLYIATK